MNQFSIGYISVFHISRYGIVLSMRMAKPNDGLIWIPPDSWDGQVNSFTLWKQLAEGLVNE